MEIFDVFLVIIGLLVIIVSYFVSEKLTDKQEEGKETLVNLNIEELIEKEEPVIIEKIEKMLQNKSEEKIVDIDNQLGQICNEKIMSITEYSDQILEKITQNHSEVVFLYNMLNEKEQELKDLIKEISTIKTKVDEKKEEKIEKKQVTVLPKQRPAEKRIKKEIEKIKMPEKEKDISGIDLLRKSEKKKKNSIKKNISELPKIDQQMKIVGTNNLNEENNKLVDNTNNNEQILKLYEEGKSVMEISKLLEMGQGEVKLVIDLFCNTKKS